jgi:hypothetical protein
MSRNESDELLLSFSGLDLSPTEQSLASHTSIANQTSTELAGIQGTCTIELLQDLISQPEVRQIADDIFSSAFLRTFLLRCCCHVVFSSSSYRGLKEVSGLVPPRSSPQYRSQKDVQRIKEAIRTVLGSHGADLIATIAEALVYLSSGSLADLCPGHHATFKKRVCFLDIRSACT